MSSTEQPDNAQGVKHKGAAKTARIPIKVVPLEEKLKKPSWIRAKVPTGKKFFEIKHATPLLNGLVLYIHTNTEINLVVS